MEVTKIAREEMWKVTSRGFCTLVTIDIAFNYATWGNIYQAFEKKKIPLYIKRIIRTYLKDRAIKYITIDWIQMNGLAGVPAKTRAFMLIGRKRCGHIEFMVQDTKVLVSNSMKYQGVHLDRDLTFGVHEWEVISKAERTRRAIQTVSSIKRATVI